MPKRNRAAEEGKGHPFRTGGQMALAATSQGWWAVVQPSGETAQGGCRNFDTPLLAAIEGQV